MERLPASTLKTAVLMAAMPAFAFSATIPFPPRVNPPILLAMPTANVLGHNQYMLSGRFQYFTTHMIGDTASGQAVEDAEPAEVKNLTYNSELLFGIENRAELGVQYGQELSFSVKALLVREDVFWPDLVFGVRNLLGSPEGGLYGIEDSKVMSSLYGESYMTAAKTFPSSSRVHLGLSYLNGANKSQVGVNLGLEQDLGGGAYLGYEVFERFSDFHQLLTLNWRYKDFIAMSLGFTEFQSWIRQDGEWGFFLTPSNSRRDGYNSPGITLSLQVLGFAPKRNKRTLPERVAILEVRNVELEKRVLEMQEALLRSQARPPEGPAPGAAPASPAPREMRGQVVALLRSATDKMAMEISDPEEVRQIMHALVSMGPPGAEALRAVAADTSAGPIRVSAVLTMAYSRDSAHGPLLRALCADRDARIRREALTALTKVHPKSALEDARRLIGDPDETVALAAGEAYRLLGGEPGPVDADRLPAAAPDSGGKPVSPAKPKAKAKATPKPQSKSQPKGGKTAPARKASQPRS